jgi:hypothetical protein
VTDLTEKQWDDLLRFEKRLKGDAGLVTIPTRDFRALMDAIRQFGTVIAAHVEEEVAE